MSCAYHVLTACLPCTAPYYVQVRGAFVSILTRSFTQEGIEDEEKRLVPLLDMLQHAAAAESNVRLCLHASSTGFTHRASWVHAPADAAVPLTADLLLVYLQVRHAQLEEEATEEEEGSQRVVATARRPIAQGEELLMCYDDDEYEPETFLTRFGFVPGGEMGEFIASIKEKDKRRLPFGFRIG